MKQNNKLFSTLFARHIRRPADMAPFTRWNNKLFIAIIFIAVLVAPVVFCARYAAAQSFIAKLPYENKQSFIVTQGYNSPPTHIHKDAYAADFTQNGCGAYGKNVLAAAPGKAWIVEEAGYNGGYGTEILVLSDGNVVSRYAHLIQGSVSVAAGDTVKTGAVLGKLGNTGLVMGAACANHPGAHLHFAMYDKNADGSFSARNFEPISGYTNIKEGAWYVSDNGAPETGLLGDIGAIMTQAAGNLFGAASGVGSTSGSADNGSISGASSPYENSGTSSASGAAPMPSLASRDFSGENSGQRAKITTEDPSSSLFSTGQPSDGNNVFDAIAESSSAERLNMNNGMDSSSAPSGTDGTSAPENSPDASSSVLDSGQDSGQDSAALSGTASQNYSSGTVSSAAQDISGSSGGGNGSTSSSSQGQILITTSGSAVSTGGVSVTSPIASSSSAASPEDSSLLALTVSSGTIGQVEGASSSTDTDGMSDYNATSSSISSSSALTLTTSTANFATSSSAPSTENLSPVADIDSGDAISIASSSVTALTTSSTATSTSLSVLINGFSSAIDATSTASSSTAVFVSSSTATSVASSSATSTQLSDTTSSATSSIAIPASSSISTDNPSLIIDINGATSTASSTSLSSAPSSASVFIFAPPSPVTGTNEIAVFNSSTPAIDFAWVAPQNASGSSDGIIYSIFDLDAVSTSSGQAVSGNIINGVASGTPLLWTGTSTEFSYPVFAAGSTSSTILGQASLVTGGGNYHFGIQAVDAAGNLSLATATVAVPDWFTTFQPINANNSHGSWYSDNWYDLGTGFYGTIRTLTLEGYIDDPFFLKSYLWIEEFLDPGYTKLNQQFTVSNDAPFIHANGKITIGGLNIPLQPNKYYRLYTSQGCQNRSVILKGTTATGTAMWNAFIYGAGRVQYTYSFYPYISWMFVPNFPPHISPNPPTNITTSLDPSHGQLDFSWSAAIDPATTASSSLTYEINCGTSTTLNASNWQSVGGSRLGFCTVDTTKIYFIGVRAVDDFGNVSMPTIKTWSFSNVTTSSSTATSTIISTASSTSLSAAPSSAPVFIFAPPSPVTGTNEIAVFNSSTPAIDFAWVAPQNASGSSDGIIYSIFDLDAVSTSSPQAASGNIINGVASGTPLLWTGTSTEFSYPVFAAGSTSSTILGQASLVTGGGNYHFGIQAADAAGNLSFATATVAVPDLSTPPAANDDISSSSVFTYDFITTSSTWKTNPGIYTGVYPSVPSAFPQVSQTIHRILISNVPAPQHPDTVLTLSFYGDCVNDPMMGSMCRGFGSYTSEPYSFATSSLSATLTSSNDGAGSFSADYHDYFAQISERPSGDGMDWAGQLMNTGAFVPATGSSAHNYYPNNQILTLTMEP